MKYQPNNDLIDPDEQGSPLDFEFDDTDEPELPEDAYVIGANGASVNDPGSDRYGTTQKVPSRWLKPAAIVSIGLFVVLTIVNLGRLAQGPPLPPKPSAFQSKQALYLGVMKIETYRRINGVVPDSLTEAGIDAAGAYEFKRISPTRYVLSFRNRGLKVEYDSIEPKERFFGSPKDMLTMGDSQ